MSKKIYARDGVIRTHVANDEYRDGWERVFGPEERSHISPSTHNVQAVLCGLMSGSDALIKAAYVEHPLMIMARKQEDFAGTVVKYEGGDCHGCKEEKQAQGSKEVPHADGHCDPSKCDRSDCCRNHRKTTART